MDAFSRMHWQITHRAVDSQACIIDRDTLSSPRSLIQAAFMASVNDIRSTFLDYFGKNGHEVVASRRWCRATTRR
jgi:hypothetical protein